MASGCTLQEFELNQQVWFEGSRSNKALEEVSLLDFSLLRKPTLPTFNPILLLGRIVEDSERPWKDAVPSDIDETLKKPGLKVCTGVLEFKGSPVGTALASATVHDKKRSVGMRGRSDLLHVFHKNEVILAILESKDTALSKLEEDPRIRQRVLEWYTIDSKINSSTPRVGLVTGVLVNFQMGQRSNVVENRFAIRTERVPFSFALNKMVLPASNIQHEARSPLYEHGTVDDEFYIPGLEINPGDPGRAPEKDSSSPTTRLISSRPEKADKYSKLKYPKLRPFNKKLDTSEESPILPFSKAAPIPSSLYSSVNDRSLVADERERDMVYWGKAHKLDSPDDASEVPLRLRNLSLSRDIPRYKTQTHRYICKWELPIYMRSQFDPGQSLSSVITLTGTTIAAQATTCGEYVSHFWPNDGKALLGALDELLRTDRLASRSVNPTTDIYVGYNKYNIHDVTDVSITYDPLHYPHEVADTLRWLAATFRNSPYNSAVATSHAFFKTDRCDTELLLDTLEPVITPVMCWHSLFTHTPIAVEFPIFPRIDGVGLAIAPTLMAYMAGIIMPVEYHGGLILKGLSSILVPIRECDDGKAIQWHLFATHPTDGFFSLRTPESGDNDIDFLKIQDAKTLFEKQAYLGWCKEAKILLGTLESKYAAVNWSGPAPEQSRYSLSGFTLGLSSSGMGAFGPSTALNFAIAKNQRARFMDIEQQLTVRLKLSISKPSLIYDTASQRAWLIPVTSLLLHMMHLRHRELTKRSVSVSPQSMPYSETSAEGGYEAYKVLMTYLRSDMETSLGSSTMWRDALATLCTALDMALKDAREMKDKVSRNEDSEIYGFELLNIVRADSPFRFSERKVQKQSGGWASIAQQVGYVLFCSDLGDAMVPSPSANHLCQHWMTVPSQRDYLSAYVPCVQEVLERQGMHTGVKLLQDQNYQRSLYEECTHEDGQRCFHLKSYDALLKSSKKTCGTTSTVTLKNDSNPGSQGAIIFGKFIKLPKRTLPIATESNCNGVATKPRMSVLRRALYRLS